MSKCAYDYTLIELLKLPRVDFALGFTQEEVTLQEEDGKAELTIAIVTGQGTEVPFIVEYFTTDGSAQGIHLVNKLRHC